ncbi:hypothetical protein BG74_01245 [Sodalis-like endosymbiont of Proechinophthirus fluctus]|nr:hypothetical protein [Sodalis-like endosymbiont of Proechinophthirus fluctus]KYP97664.1 hypothetical protein BG74_01245 [Sodalis-like endosymbiont of Proechinophthirus fluctus]
MLIKVDSRLIGSGKHAPKHDALWKVALGGMGQYRQVRQNQRINAALRGISITITRCHAINIGMDKSALSDAAFASLSF